MSGKLRVCFFQEAHDTKPTLIYQPVHAAPNLHTDSTNKPNGIAKTEGPLIKKTGRKIRKLAKQEPFVAFSIGFFILMAAFFILELLSPEAFTSMLGGTIFFVWYSALGSVAPPLLYLGMFFLVVVAGCKVTDLVQKRQVRKLHDESGLSFEETTEKLKIMDASHVAVVYEESRKTKTT